MTDLGGIAYMPGEAWTITWTPSPAVADSDAVKLIFGGLTITGTVASGGESVAFLFTAAQTATLTAYYIYDARVTVNDTERTESYDFTTGPSVTGTATYPAVPDVLKIEAGTGITCSPDPIITSGTVSLDAGLDDLSGVTITSGITAGDRLQFNGSLWTDVTPDPMIPRPGFAYRVLVGQAWNPYAFTPAYENVYRESFFRAGGGSESTGDVELKSSGVEFIVSASGWVEDYSPSGSKRYGPMNATFRLEMYLENDTSDNSLTLHRGAFVDDANSGFYIVVDYVEA
mgnify:CR=1 FL=1|tara:strand:+ start:3457 stop:4314 length:858 start_codon:yes stop_codon:yes gene_type:complete